jgi:DNA repair exonuclease SbcCD ATPase subunit
MQLPAWSRRSVIEDLLDINIFSKMNTLLKERNSKIKDELVDINHRIDLLKTKITGQNKYIKDLQSLNQDQIDNKKDSIEVHKTDIKATFEESKKLGENLETLLKEEDKRYRTNNEELSTFRSLDLQHASGIKDLVKESRFYEDNDHCPTCDQDIELEKKNEKQSQIKSKAAQIQTDKTILAKQIEDAQAELQDIQNKTNQLRQKQQKINSNNDKITLLQKEIDKIQKEIGQLTSATGDVSKAKQDLNNSRKSKEDITEKKLEYVEERTYNEVIGEMLKDTGIKTKVIKQYLPVMNRLINQYLQILDFFVAFHLDENFNETIRSRHRDSFNYSSFSEGEKQRIDLSLLFTWRQIAKLKNSAATNLLVLDETFDSSLDADGVESLTKILGTLEEGSNVFIISHKGDILENKFRSKIEFFKEKNFSKIK